MSRQLLLICKHEIKSICATWTGLLTITLILLFDGLLFNAYAVGSKARPSTDVIYSFFYMASGIAIVAAAIFSSGSIAEERQNGSFVLFTTAPIHSRTFVYAKFFSYLTLLTSVHLLSLYIPSLIFIHGKISVGHIASGYIGIFLLTSACLAIGIFASSLASNQIIATILATSFIVVLLILWLLAAITAQPWREFFSYIALHNQHFPSFAHGVIHVKHIVYYVSVTALFLELATYRTHIARSRGV